MAWNLPQTGHNATEIPSRGNFCNDNDPPSMEEFQNGSLLLNQTEGESTAAAAPSSLISDSTAMSIISGVNLYVFPCVFLVGVSTNVLNCAVYCRLVSGPVETAIRYFCFNENLKQNDG